MTSTQHYENKRPYPTHCEQHFPDQDTHRGVAKCNRGCVAKELLAGKSVQLQNFGTMEIKRKNAREVVHPQTKERTVVPEKMQLTFKPNQSTKEQLKNV